MKLFFLLFFLIIASVLGNAQTIKKEFLVGDIIFQNLDCGPLCDAIEAVTEGYKGYDFSHVGLIIIKNDSLYVVEAIGANVKMTSIAEFLNRSIDLEGKPKVMVGRLLSKYNKIIPKACKLALKDIGKPYDDRFLEDNDSLYCSEHIYEVFKTANRGIELFHKMPMTYKQPNSNTFYEAWVNYFLSLKSPIPEGKMGINPGLISRSEHLIMVYQLGVWKE